MSKWILMPDSFKGTMSSLEICQLMREALLRHVPDAEVVSIPVADGGEGSVEAFLAAMGGHRVEVPCTGPDFRKISGFYGLLADGYTAVIEMAAAAGLPLMEGRLCAEGATTYGVGELILAAIRDGARRIILGLGGSATNDGGCGAAAALGVEFYGRRSGRPLSGRHRGGVRPCRRHAGPVVPDRHVPSLPPAERCGDRDHVRCGQPPLRSQWRQRRLRPPEGGRP